MTQQTNEPNHYPKSMAKEAPWSTGQFYAILSLQLERLIGIVIYVKY